MSRLYEMSLVVRGAAVDENTISEAADEHWNFEDWSSYNKEISAHGQSNLCGGETEEEFAQRLTESIWKANGKFCEVEVIATYLEDLPHENYLFDEEDYQRFLDFGGPEEE